MKLTPASAKSRYPDLMPEAIISKDDPKFTSITKEITKFAESDLNCVEIDVKGYKTAKSARYTWAGKLRELEAFETVVVSVRDDRVFLVKRKVGV